MVILFETEAVSAKLPGRKTQNSWLTEVVFLFRGGPRRTTRVRTTGKFRIRVLLRLTEVSTGTMSVVRACKLPGRKTQNSWLTEVILAIFYPALK